MRYEDGQIAEVRLPSGKTGLGKYHRHSKNPELDWWQVMGRDGFVNPPDAVVVQTYVAIPVSVHEGTEAAVARRPSFQHLMAAQEALGEARDAEQAAGNSEQAKVLNDLVLLLFGFALREE